MKKNFEAALFVAIVATVFLSFNFNISSCTSGSASGSGSRNGPKTFPIKTKVPIYAGSRIEIECGSPDCQLIFRNGSPDTSGTKGHPKYTIPCRIPFDIPANTRLLITFRGEGDSAESGKETPMQ
jgi:hypothetical protein